MYMWWTFDWHLDLVELIEEQKEFGANLNIGAEGVELTSVACFSLAVLMKFLRGAFASLCHLSCLALIQSSRL